MTADNLASPITSRRAALALIAAMLALTVWHSVISYRDADKAAETMVAALTRTMDYQTDSMLRGADDLLQEAVQRIDPAQWPNATNTEWLRLRLAALPEVRNLLVVSPDGKSIGTGLSATGPVGTSLDISDRQYFRSHRDHPDIKRTLVGDPVTGRLDGHQIIPLSRAVVDSEGRFKGIIGVSIDPTFMINALESLLIEDAGGGHYQAPHRLRC